MMKMSTQSSNLPESTAKNILAGFEKHYCVFQQASVQAKSRFDRCEWRQLLDDYRARLYFYDKQVKQFCLALKKELNTDMFDEKVWINTKLAYINLTSNYKQPELAETFYNSVFCLLFDKRFYNNNFIFVKPSISTTFIDMDDPIIDSHYIKASQLEQTLQSVFNKLDFVTPYQDLTRDVSRLKQQFVKQLSLLEDEDFELQLVKSTFFRRKAAYIVGEVVLKNNQVRPVLIVLLNDEKTGIYVDALLTDVDNISIVFSFSRSYFFIDTDYPAAVVDFLKSILPGKTKAELYSSIGLHKHGKTLLYRRFLKYSRSTGEKLIIAPGVKGMVMTVFTFPMFPYVFKVINDNFAPPKTATKQQVKDKYFFVKNHCKVGRLADTWEFSNVAFPIRDLDKKLLNELKSKVGSSIMIEGDLLIIKHLYMENKMIPLNLYMKNAKNEDLEHIVNDYGRAIDELINADIFPGDMLTKNFGVTRQNRVVFYDYDEITTMDQPVFRKIPDARHEEDEMAAEPWYYVGPEDVFPEEFKLFMFNQNDSKKIFSKSYEKLLSVDYWKSVQDNIKNGNIIDYYPYRQRYRMSQIYSQSI